MARLVLIVLSLLPAINCEAVQCRSSTGQPVDWFIVYKTPEVRGAKPPFSSGYGHFYMDVNSPTWSMSQVSMNDSNQAVSYTLRAIYSSQKSSDFMYAMYNDEDPNKREPRSAGHSKGVLAFDKTSGFWLVHSTPRFPPFKENGYKWPHTAKRYGQSFLCVSYKYGQLDQIAKQIMINYVYVYDKWAPQTFLTDNPNLAKVINHVKPTSPSSRIDLVSKQGTKFVSFAKASFFGKDLYSDLIAPFFGSTLLTETWQNGRGKLPSNCTGQYKVYNIQMISLQNSINFKETKDHSKWAVTMSNGNWVCIGDINRQKHQELRGGGTVCLQNQSVWKSFLKSVKGYEKC